MILSIMVFNNHGKPRLLKFYKQTVRVMHAYNRWLPGRVAVSTYKGVSHYSALQPLDLQQEMLRETFQLVTKRPDSVCNFLEGGR